MSFRACPVANFRQRAVYKTEFDLFKQNTELDLISLISYQEDEQCQQKIGKKHVYDRPKTVPYEDCVKRRLTVKEIQDSQARSNERRYATKSATESHQRNVGIRKGINTGSKQSHARIKCETELYKDFAKTSKRFLKLKAVSNRGTDRQCSSALDVRDQREPLLERTRSQTTCGFRPNDRTRAVGAYQSRCKSKTSAQYPPKGNTYKPIVSVNLVTTVNKAWLLRTAAITGHDLSSNVIGQQHKRPYTGRSSKTIECKIQKSCNDKTIQKYTESSELSSNSSITTVVASGYLSLNAKSSMVDEDNDTKYEHSNCSEFDISQHSRQETYISGENPSVRYKKWIRCTDQYDLEPEGNEEPLENGDHLRSVCFLQSNEYIGSKDSGIDSNTASPEIDFSHSTESDNIKGGNERHVQFNEQVIGQHCNEEDLNLDSISNIEEADSERSTELDTDETASKVVYDVNDLISDLERFGNQSRLSVASAGILSHQGFEESNSLIAEPVKRTNLQSLEPSEEHQHSEVNLEDIAEDQETIQAQDDIVMSREARHAILETLNDMGGAATNKRTNGKENFSAKLRHKSVNAQRRMKDNRSKYDHYMNERTKKLPRNQFQSLDSIGNEDWNSQFSSPTNVKGCDDDNSSCEREAARGKLFPSIRENTKLSKGTMKSNNTQSKVYSLEQVKKKKYKIPGIGNYNLVTSPENDFEITPPGFDSRYTPKPFISKEEQEIPPRFIRERSIQKCRKWLDNVNMSPMALRPVKDKSENI